MRTGQYDWVSLRIPQPCGLSTDTVSTFFWGISMSCVVLRHDRTQYFIYIYIYIYPLACLVPGIPKCFRHMTAIKWLCRILLCCCGWPAEWFCSVTLLLHMPVELLCTVLLCYCSMRRGWLCKVLLCYSTGFIGWLCRVLLCYCSMPLRWLCRVLFCYCSKPVELLCTVLLCYCSMPLG